MPGTDGLASASDYLAKVPPRFKGSVLRSTHLTMRDGVRIAIDVHFPDAIGRERVPTIVRQTRYCRALIARTGLGKIVTDDRLDPLNASLRSTFVSRGYAWVDVDVRGSGASFGRWRTPWSPEEVRDGAEIVDWIVQQDWSNGKVGATGNSYDGTAAEMLLVNQHPAVKAIVARCSLFDVYPDIAFPGGLHLSWFTQSWTRLNQALDANCPELGIAELLALGRPELSERWPRKAVEVSLAGVLAGVRPVDGAGGRKLLRQAIAEHIDNSDVHQSALGMAYRDDPDPTPAATGTMELFSPSSYIDRIRGSGAAVMSISGWFDGAYPHSAIKRHLALAAGGSGHRLIIGPWNHGIGMNVSPHAPGRRVAFNLAGEMLRFFDRHLVGKMTGMEREAPVRYYTMGEEGWRSASTWPPRTRAVARMFLRQSHALKLQAPAPLELGADEVVTDPNAGTGLRSRWRSLVSPFVVPDYADRKVSPSALIYRSDPLEAALVVSGHPLFVAFVASKEEDGALFVYLEEETPDGRVLYVTEGELRLIHRAYVEGASRTPAPYRSFLRADARPMVPDEVTRVVIDLLPVSYRFAPSSRVRLTITASDRDHFTSPPMTRCAIGRTPEHASALELPLE